MNLNSQLLECSFMCIFDTFSLQYKFAVIVMGKMEYISDDDQELKVNISQFLPHSLSGTFIVAN